MMTFSLEGVVRFRSKEYADDAFEAYDSHAPEKLKSHQIWNRYGKYAEASVSLPTSEESSLVSKIHLAMHELIYIASDGSIEWTTTSEEEVHHLEYHLEKTPVKYSRPKAQARLGEEVDFRRGNWEPDLAKAKAKAKANS